MVAHNPCQDIADQLSSNRNDPGTRQPLSDSEQPKSGRGPHALAPGPASGGYTAAERLCA
jgi:hypothetical protein